MVLQILITVVFIIHLSHSTEIEKIENDQKQTLSKKNYQKIAYSIEKKSKGVEGGNLEKSKTIKSKHNRKKMSKIRLLTRIAKG